MIYFYQHICPGSNQKSYCFSVFFFFLSICAFLNFKKKNPIHTSKPGLTSNFSPGPLQPHVATNSEIEIATWVWKFKAQLSKGNKFLRAHWLFLLMFLFPNLSDKPRLRGFSLPPPPPPPAYQPASLWSLGPLLTSAGGAPWWPLPSQSRFPAEMSEVLRGQLFSHDPQPGWETRASLERQAKYATNRTEWNGGEWCGRGWGRTKVPTNSLWDSLEAGLSSSGWVLCLPPMNLACLHKILTPSKTGLSIEDAAFIWSIMSHMNWSSVSDIKVTGWVWV